MHYGIFHNMPFSEAGGFHIAVMDPLLPPPPSSLLPPPPPSSLLLLLLPPLHNLSRVNTLLCIPHYQRCIGFIVLCLLVFFHASTPARYFSLALNDLNSFCLFLRSLWAKNQICTTTGENKCQCRRMLSARWRRNLLLQCLKLNILCCVKHTARDLCWCFTSWSYMFLIIFGNLGAAEQSVDTKWSDSSFLNV